VHIRHASTTATASHVEHLGQYIVQVHVMPVSSARAALEGRHAVGVVHVPLLVILEDFVGCLDGFEALFCLCSVLFGMLVRVT
jgi:hypothetical protein